jgi:predicted phosphodiesterase
MTYAVISDIHGNMPAFKAVLEDAKAKGATSFLLLGDYVRDVPFLNEVADAIRSLPNCTAILGNGDIGVLSLHKTKPIRCEFEQMLPNFWTYHHLSRENLDFLLSLPETADLTTPGGKQLHLSHSISLIGHTPPLGVFHSGYYAKKMERAPFTFKEGMDAMQAAAKEYEHEIVSYPGDICLFGHNHLQFAGKAGGKILLNPGSCGYPGDNDTRAAYATICDDGGEPVVNLQRVAYDMDETLMALRSFNDFPQAKFWSRMHIATLQSASGIMWSRFWEHASKIGDGKSPMENELWREAVETYAL